MDSSKKSGSDVTVYHQIGWEATWLEMMWLPAELPRPNHSWKQKDWMGKTALLVSAGWFVCFIL